MVTVLGKDLGDRKVIRKMTSVLGHVKALQDTKRFPQGYRALSVWHPGTGCKPHLLEPK